MDTMPIAIVVPPNAQSLDISGPLDAFLEANRQAPSRCNYDVRLLSIGPDRAVKAGSMSLVADASIFEDEGPIDTLLVAGTPDYAQAYAETALPAWLRRQRPRSRRHGSVCTGAFFLGAAGLLDGKSATTHHEFLDQLETKFPKVKVQRGVRFVEGEKISTAGGLSSGIDLALRVVERYYGRPAAERTAAYMEYQGKGWLV